MKYSLQFTRRADQLVNVLIETVAQTDHDAFALSHWRPGRYELQSFPRLVAGVRAADDKGNRLICTIKDANTWQVQAAPGTPIRISYAFYANQADAGGSYVDNQQIYLNPINLLMARPGEYEAPCTLNLFLPEGFELGGPLPGEGPSYEFQSYHELVDTPFFAAAAGLLKHHAFTVKGLAVHLWFLGEGKPDMRRIETDLTPITEAQHSLFGIFPHPEFHYLVLLLPNKFRHGVEHEKCTVLAMGPGIQLNEPGMYRSFLELCSHEFFHTWNVKTLRPADLFPYDYSRAQYSALHYVTEGVTTYYGDLMVWKAGLWNLNQWLQSLNSEMETHYNMPAKDYVSLHEASMMSWVNGYHRQGIPNNRISFYTKGYLVAFLLDTEIRRKTGHGESLDTVMREMYRTVTQAGRGYTRADFQGTAERLAGISLNDFFARYFTGVFELIPALVAAGDFYGFGLNLLTPPGAAEGKLGIAVTMGMEVDQVWPGSPAHLAGILRGDQLVAIQGQKLEQNLDELTGYFSAEENDLKIHYFRQNKLASTTLDISMGWQRFIPQFVASTAPHPVQLANREAWQSAGVSEFR